jgi:hypothetical protein
VVDHNPAKPSRDSDLAFSVVTELVKQGIKKAIADADQLLDYPELAKRLRLGVSATKDLVNCGKITPALRYANVARFHWPSVLQELKKIPFVSVDSVQQFYAMQLALHFALCNFPSNNTATKNVKSFSLGMA